MQPQPCEEPKIVSAITGEHLLEIFRKEGFYAELTHDLYGDPKLSFKVEGFRCAVYFYGVENGAASSLQFRTGFRAKKPLEKVNLWNLKKRFLKAYLDDEGDLILEYDVDLEGGVTETHLAEQIKLFRLTLLSCLQFMRDQASSDSVYPQMNPPKEPQ